MSLEQSIKKAFQSVKGDISEMRAQLQILADRQEKLEAAMNTQVVQIRETKPAKKTAKKSAKKTAKKK
jgi:hypothetical protein